MSWRTVFGLAVGFVFLGGASGGLALAGAQPAGKTQTPKFLNVGQSDAFITPWLTAPNVTWETTDIWVDQPENGYAAVDSVGHVVGCSAAGCGYDLSGSSEQSLVQPPGDWAPHGNGDVPSVFYGASSGLGVPNRIWVRVRNIGTAPIPAGATVHVERADPEGMGILGAVNTAPVPGGPGWKEVGGSPSGAPGPPASLPLAIPPGGYEDVSVDYLPIFPPPTWGIFPFHTCLHVWVDPVPGETVVNNQAAYENIASFEADVIVGVGLRPNVFKDVVLLRNYSRLSHTFILSTKSGLPAGWKVVVNHGQSEVSLKAEGRSEIPITITSPRVSKPKTKPGTRYTLDLSARYAGPNAQKQPPLGGMHYEIDVVEPTKLSCSATRTKGSAGRIRVSGRLEGAQQTRGLSIFVIAARSKPLQFLKTAKQLAQMDAQGRFSVLLPSSKTRPDKVLCQFSGTQTLGRATAPLAPIR